MKRTRYSQQRGLTLIELTIVLLVLVGLGGLLLPFVGGTTQFSQCTATDTSMRTIRDAITGSFEQPGYFEDMQAMPATLDDLRNMPAGATAFNPVTKRGWNGPYLFTEATDAYNLNDITIQIPAVDGDGNDCTDIDPAYQPQDCARLVSPGPTDDLDDGLADTALADANGINRGDDRITYLLIPDPNANLNSPCTETL